MRKGTRRYVAWLCVFCMLLTSIPYSVLSDNAPATPTNLQPDTVEITQEDGIRNIDAPAAEPAEQENERPEPEPEQPADGENAAGEGKLKANRELVTGNDQTIKGKLEKKEYLVRFTPSETQTAYLILSSDKQLEAVVTAEETGAAVRFVPDGTDEDGRNVWIAAEYKTGKDQAYLVRITGAVSAEFTLRIVKKSVLTRERETENTERAEEEPGEETEKQTEEEVPEEPADEKAEETGRTAGNCRGSDSGREDRGRNRHAGRRTGD